SLPTATVAPPASTAPVSSAAPSASASSKSMIPHECRANIRSYPLGVSILWNGELLGNTPLNETPVPCGPARVTFQLAGYETTERSAGPIVGKASGVFARLTPVPIPLEITSTPPGAQILIEGRSMGRTPTTVTLMGPRESTIALRLPGYQPWTRKFTPELPK